jgi:ceramide glucosyltransferase
VARKLIREFPARDARLVVCRPLTGANLKVCKLAELERLARHDLVVVSDADVRVPPDFLANVVAPLESPAVGLVNCFYCLANATTLAMRWEALAANADFWSQVLQARSLKPLDFALGAVMTVRRACLREIGGFEALADVLADDYQLGNRIARRGHVIALCPVVVECWSGPMGWAAAWKHQLRWARTIRVCQPTPYFFSILSNPTLWPLVWAAACPSRLALCFLAACLLARLAMASDLQRRLAAHPQREDGGRYWGDGWMASIKDLLQVAIWLLAFTGNRIEWRGQRMRLRPDGTMVKE